MDKWHNHVDLYCERTDAAFWSEPLNALTNFAFLLAAIFMLALWRQNRTGKWDIAALIILTAFVGVGSFIFHTIATSGAMLFDVVPIIVFIHFSIWVIFSRVLGLKWWQSIIGVIAFATFNILVLNAFGRAMFNGSIQYMPTLVLLIGVSIFSYTKKLHVTREFMIASTAFLISITCRSLDMQICETLPIGIHFLWHTLNAVTMYYVMKGLNRSEVIKV